MTINELLEKYQLDNMNCDYIIVKNSYEKKGDIKVLTHDVVADSSGSCYAKHWADWEKEVYRFYIEPIRNKGLWDGNYRIVIEYED